MLLDLGQNNFTIGVWIKLRSISKQINQIILCILNIIIINSLRAVGDTKFPMYMAILSMWGVSVSVGCFLGIYMQMGLLGVWLGFCADECSRGLIMLARWKSKAWVKRAVKYYKKNYAKLKTA